MTSLRFNDGAAHSGKDTHMDNTWQGLGAWPTLLALGGAVLLGAFGLLAVLWEALWPDARQRRWGALQPDSTGPRPADAHAAGAEGPDTQAGASLAAAGALSLWRAVRSAWQGWHAPLWLRRGGTWLAPLWHTLAPPLQRLLGSLGAAEAPLRQLLLQAGWRGPHAVQRYRLAAAAGLLGLPLLLWWLLQPWGGSAAGGRSDATPGLPLWLLAAWIGLRLPDAVLAWRRRQRQRLIFNALPGALDLMRVCVQAGLGLDAAMDRVGRELRWSCPPLSQELAVVGLQLRAGAARGEALHQMAARIGLPEFDSLVGVLVQSERFGTPVGQALQTQAVLLRERRRQRAEAAAARLPVQLVLPLVLCVLPALLTVLLGPAVLGVLQNLLPNLAAR
jgi:tight adherence protein C